MFFDFLLLYLYLPTYMHSNYWILHFGREGKQK